MADTSGSAELEIHQLVARYCEAVNRRDAEAWGATWAGAAEWQLLGSATRGREAIVARWRELMEAIPFVLQLPSFGSVVLADPAAASATGSWYIHELTERGSGLGLTLGLYRDDYRREEGRWRFARRRFEVLHREKPALGGSLLGFSMAPVSLPGPTRTEAS